MKTVYISESMAKLLKESVLADAFPSDIMRAIETDQTPFGNNPDFKMGKKFLVRAATTQFDSARNELKNMGRIEDVDADSIGEAFNKIVLRCQEIENKNKDVLEKLAANYVVSLFSVPDDTVKIVANLVNKIENGDKISPVEPFDGDVNFQLTDIAEITSLDNEIYKRQILNALSMGAGMRMSANIRGYLEELYDVDSRLPQLYKEALALNNYMIFNNKDLGITDKTRNQIGLVEVKYGSPDELVTIKAQGVIFPVLLCELIRGFMELFSSHGLPKKRDRMDYILGKTDFLKAEPWLMRVGPYMWETFTEYFEDTDTEDMPYIFQILSKLKPQTFFDVISEMFAHTEKGKKYAKILINKALENKDRAAFTDRMMVRQTKKNIITDGYMGPEEF